MIALTTDHYVTNKEDESNLTQEFVFYEPTEKIVLIEHHGVYNNGFLE